MFDPCKKNHQLCSALFNLYNLSWWEHYYDWQYLSWNNISQCFNIFHWGLSSNVSFYQEVAPCSTNGCVCPLLTVPQLSLCHNMLFKGFSLFTAQQFSCFGSPTSNLSAADGWCSFEMVSQRSRHSDFMYFVYQVTFIYIYSTLYNTYFFKAAFTVMNTNCLCCKIHQLWNDFNLSFKEDNSALMT